MNIEDRIDLSLAYCHSYILQLLISQSIAKICS